MFVKTEAEPVVHLSMINNLVWTGGWVGRAEKRYLGSSLFTTQIF